jgi:hypothetical protein
MPLWLSVSLALLFFFVTTFLGTWAIREGGSFAFLIPSHWKRRRNAGSQDAVKDRPKRRT